MKREDLSLMIFPFGYDLMRGSMTLEEVFALTGRKGLKSVDVLGINEALLEPCRQASEKTGVAVHCFIAHVSFFHDETQIAADLKAALERAKVLNASLFMIVPYTSDDELILAANEGREAVQARMVRGFRLAVEMAKDFALPVCYETTPHDELALSGTEDCLYVLDNVPGLGLVFDTANMLPHGEDTLDAYEALKDRIVYIHLKDVALEPMDPFNALAEHTPDGMNMRGVVWGDGVIPVKETAERLQRDGYSGKYAVEYAHPGAFSIEAHDAQIDKFLKYFDL